jgi:predicted Zn finger-like uncharacterized protein
MVSDPLTDGWYVQAPTYPDDAMLIACPNCATSYNIEPASLGAAGRTVRCARCKTTWFASGLEAAPEMTASADDALADGETRAPVGVIRPDEPVAGTAADATSTEHDGEVASRSATADAPHPEPVTIADAPSVVPPIEPPTALHSTAKSETDEADNFVARRKRLQARRVKARRSSHWTALILVLFAFNVALIGARSEVVRFFPQTASLFSAIGLPVNLRNLKFENMRISKETQEGLSALVIEGNIVSIAGKPTEVPRLRFAARDAAGQEVYTWSSMPSRSTIGPGEKLEFRSRLVSPPESATDVVVRFFGPQDSVVGAK